METPILHPNPPHIPVLARQVTEYLAQKPDGKYFDGTLGAGGHSAWLLDTLSPNGRLVSVDLDPAAIAMSRERFADEPRIQILEASYRQLPAIFEEIGWDSCDGMLLDLGVSSMQIDNPGRGFSFSKQGPLDMRFSSSHTQSAAELVNLETAQELAHILRTYGEEPMARRIAAAIEQARNRNKLATTADLAQVVKSVAPGHKTNKTLARVFQALRIVVNQELKHLKDFMDCAVKYLAPGGRIAVISYHSLEDRIVKTAFSYYRKNCICPPELPLCVCSKISELRILTGKPVRPSAEEVTDNSRARSARLRVAEKLPHDK